MLVNPAKIKDETIQNLRDNGYMVIIFSPEEFGSVTDYLNIQDSAINYINELIEDNSNMMDAEYDIIGEDDLT